MDSQIPRRRFLRATALGAGALLTPALLAACGGAAPTATTGAVPAPAGGATGATATRSGTATATTYPLTIQNCGNTVTVSRPPQRVATLFPPVTELVIALGQKDRIVLASAFSGDPQILPEYRADYQAVPSLSTNEGPKKEVLLAARPDLVIDNQPDYFYNATQGFATQDELRAAGAQVYSFGTNCGPQRPDARVEDFFVDIANVGSLLGVPDRAAALVADQRRRIDAAKQRVAGQRPASVLVYDSGDGPLTVWAGNSSRFAIFRAIGATNVFPDLPAGYGQVAAERIAATDPDVIVVSGYTAAGVPSTEERIAFITKTFPNLRTVKEGRVAGLQYSYMNPSIQSARGVEEAAKLLYPAAFR